MKKRTLLFSLLSIATFTATSCSGSGITHTRSAFNKVYKADLNYNGKIDPDEENRTWAETYDVLLKRSNSMEDLNDAVKAFNIDENDPSATSLARSEILHQAEELIMSTGAVFPICNYIDPYLLKKEVSNLYTMNLGFKFMDKLKRKSGNKDFVVTVGTKAESFDPANNSDASTALALYQCMAGAKRYVKGDKEQEGEEKGRGIYEAVLEDGVCEVTKKLVTTDDVKDDDPDWIRFDKCDDLEGENPEHYEGTARWTIKLNKGAVWSDGTPITVDDFIYAWTRASSAVYNGQPFGTWCQVFDSIRGFNVWNTIGQQPNINFEQFQTNKSFSTSYEYEKDKFVNKIVKDGKGNWYKVVKNYNANSCKTIEEAIKDDYLSPIDDETTSNRKYYEDIFQKYGCAGGMVGVMPNYNEKEITIQLVNDCGYFDELLAFTAFFPVKKENIIIKKGRGEKTNICAENPTWWLNEGDKFATNGTLKIKGKIDNMDSGGITFVRNENALAKQWKDEANEVVDSLKFKFIDKDSTMYDVYKRGEAVLTNNFPIALIDELKKDKSEWHAPDQIGLYFYTFNVNDNTFDIKPEKDPVSGERNREKLRLAFSKLINRHDLAYNVYKKGTSADGYISTGITEYKPIEVEIIEEGKSKTVIQAEKEIVEGVEQPKRVPWQSRNLNQWDHWDSEGEYRNHWLDKRNDPSTGGGPGGFFDIVDNDETATPEEEKEVMEKTTKEAIELAKEAGIHYDEKTEKFTNFPRVTISTNNGTAHEDVAERIQAYMGLWGIEVDVQTIEWNSFIAARRNGDYVTARQGWIADYNDPRTYLDCNRSTDGNDDTQLGKDTWHRSH